MDLPNLDARVCGRCLLWEDDRCFSKVCARSANGKHRLERRKIWFAVLADDLWGARSPEKAMELLGELCYSRDYYLLAQQFSDAEIRALREDRAVLVLSVVPKE
jgi:hypothetical protein